MPESVTPLVERIARVLDAAATLAVLHTMREPDEAMAAVGDSDTWTRMVETALEQAEKAQSA